MTGDAGLLVWIMAARAIPRPGRPPGLLPRCLPCHAVRVLVVVRLLALPDDHRALVSPATADLMARMGQAKILDAEPDPGREPMRQPKTPRR